MIYITFGSIIANKNNEFLMIDEDFLYVWLIIIYNI